MNKSYSQCGQDTKLLQLFGDKKGFFVDVGAHDGVTLSNTKLLEENGWKGICVEPIPEVFEQLSKNRKCKCIHGCVSKLEQDEVSFCRVRGYSEMLSGIVDLYDERHKQRILQECNRHGSTRELIKIPNWSLAKILADVAHVDVLCVDVEGAEHSVIQTADFNRTQIDYILVEVNYDLSDTTSFMSGIGYELHSPLGCDYLFKKR
jgi:FkbM family methyltransferase